MDSDDKGIVLIFGVWVALILAVVVFFLLVPVDG